MTYIPNPDKPAELETLREAIKELGDCRMKGGGVDLARLVLWMRRYPDRMEDAVNVLDGVLDEHYPPVVTKGAKAYELLQL